MFNLKISRKMTQKHWMLPLLGLHDSIIGQGDKISTLRAGFKQRGNRRTRESAAVYWAYGV